MKILFLILLIGGGVMAQDFEIEKDRVYAQNSKGNLTLDIYKPQITSPAPAVLVLFPGGWNNKSANRS